ncbi:RNA polymerase sigma factor [Paenibacillaceae bacterium GAS479]|nr:RNA polymerase sigma factor [Paenibacillaceae bacterium GAS479]
MAYSRKWRTGCESYRKRGAVLLLMLFKRWLGRFSVKQEPIDGAKPLGLTIQKIQQGNESLREQLIQDYRPFILKSTSRFCKRYIDPSRDDEFSIAMIAFNEAIHQFSPESGRSFTSFAETVIRRRLIDYVRREKRHWKSLPAGNLNQDGTLDEGLQTAWTRQAVSRFQLDRDADNRRLEIEEYASELEGYGIKFTDLAGKSPKHEDSRVLLQGIALKLATEDSLWGVLVQSRRLPVKELMELGGVSRKTIERNRKYLIAVAVLLRGDYPYLSDYLQLRKEKAEQELTAGGTRL